MDYSEDLFTVSFSHEEPLIAGTLICCSCCGSDRAPPPPPAIPLPPLLVYKVIPEEFLGNQVPGFSGHHSKQTRGWPCLWMSFIPPVRHECLEYFHGLSCECDCFLFPPPPPTDVSGLKDPPKRGSSGSAPSLVLIKRRFLFVAIPAVPRDGRRAVLKQERVYIRDSPVSLLKGLPNPV